MAELIYIPKITDPRGNLSFLEEGQCIPFTSGDVRWAADISSGASIASAIEGDERRIVVPVSGSFRVGDRFLTRPDRGLLLEADERPELCDCSANTVILTIAERSAHRKWSEPQTPADGHCGAEADTSRRMPLDVNSLEGARICRLPAGFPFRPRRVYYLYDVPYGSMRGGHSHKALHEMLIAATGSFAVEVSDGNSSIRYTLNCPYEALYIPPGLWRTLDSFSAGSTCLVVDSDLYDEQDYVRSHSEYLKLRGIK